MLDQATIKKAELNVKKYLEEGLLKKQSNDTAKAMYIENSLMSLETANRLLSLETKTYKPYLWILVASYYSMFYIANAVLLEMGYKVGDKISHKVTADALIALVRQKLKKELIEEYENIKEDALELISSKTDSVVQSFEFERQKRSTFQYSMEDQIKKDKALISLERAKLFVFELGKLIP
jgi:uncharacterized protein (UPF0332 family)